VNTLTEDSLLVQIPVRELLHYLSRKTGQSDPAADLLALLNLHPGDAPDWHRILRQGLRSHLHLNLGIPGIEIPDHPIEENPAALYAALVLGWKSVFVFLSGEIELAHEEGLISKNALSKLRKKIRALD
jgi:hypothetical protein